MDNAQSMTLSQENEDCVQIVGLNEQVEETMDDLPDQANTQYVLDVEEVAPPKKQKKKQRENSPVSEETSNSRTEEESYLHMVREFMAARRNSSSNETVVEFNQQEIIGIKEHEVVSHRTKPKVMKEFIQHLKDQKKPLANCGFESFEEWACGDGLSTTYGKFQVTDWEDALNSLLFDHYSTAILELEKRRREQEEVEESGSISLQNTKTISTSSTTAHIVAQRVDVCTYNVLETTPQRHLTTVTAPIGNKARRALFPKEILQSKRRRASTSEDEVQEIIPNSFKMYMKEKQKTIPESQASVEDESKPDVDIEPPKTKKIKTVRFNLNRPRWKLSEPEEEIVEEDNSHLNTEEGYASMVADLARAHSLLKDEDGYISITSPGERGYMLMKLEMYPFNDCVKIPKNQYWTKRTFSSMAVISGMDCFAYKMLMQLRTQITKDIMKIKEVKTAKKSLTGWKTG